MPFVSVKCTACGAVLEVDEMREKAVCPFCQTPFVYEKAVNITNIYGGTQSPDELAAAGESFAVHEEFVTAYNVFDKMTEEYPNDYRGWWGMVRVRSLNFSDIYVSSEMLEKIKGWYDKAYAVASDAERALIAPRFADYIGRVEALMQMRDEEYAAKKAELEKQIEAVKKKIEVVEAPGKTFVGMIKTAIIGIIAFIALIFLFVRGLGVFLCVVILGSLIGVGAYAAASSMVSLVYEKNSEGLRKQKYKLEEELKKATREYYSSFSI